MAELARTLRFHGSRDKRTFEYVGYNSRLDELQAAVLRVLLPELDGWSDGRRAAAEAYAEAGIEQFVTAAGVPAGAEPAWHLYVATHPDADELIARPGASTASRRALLPHPAARAERRWRRYAPPAGSLPATDELARTNLALPMSPVFGPRRPPRSSRRAAAVSSSARSGLRRGRA